MSLDKLKKQLKAQQFDQLYVFCGEESYLRKYYLKSLCDKCVDASFSDFNLHILDGKTFSLEEFQAAAEALPMMGAYVVIVVKDLVPPIFNAHMISLMEPVLQDLPESTICIFDYSADIPVQKEKKYASIMKLFGNCGATVVECAPPKEGELARWVARHFAAHKKQIGRAEVSYLLSICDNSMESLKNEIDKICTFAVTDVITRQHIDQMATRSVEATIYQLSDALLDHDYDGAFRRLDKLFYLHIDPVMIAATLASSLLTVSKVKGLQESGISQKEIVALVGLRRPSLITMYSRMAGKVSRSQLDFMLHVLSRADIELKSSHMESRTVLELMLGRILEFEQKQRRSV